MPLAGVTELAVAQLSLKQEAFASWTPGATWFAWCSATGTTVTMGDAAWAAWNGSVTTTAGSGAFNYATSTAYVSTGTEWATWNAEYQETEDQRAERERQVAGENARWAAEEAARAEEREQASARALGLLRSLLSDDQWASYQDNGWFEVRGSSGRRWRVRSRGQSGNVDLMPEAGEERDVTYCAHPPGRLPDADAHAAQMLALVTDDEAFLRTANVHYRRPPTEAERAGQSGRERERVVLATARERAHWGAVPEAA